MAYNVKYKMSRSNGSRKPFESVVACGGAKSVEALAYSFLYNVSIMFKIMEDKEKQELLDCIHNLMGFFDTPIARLKLNSDGYEEVRKIGREVLKKYNIDWK